MKTVYVRTATKFLLRESTRVVLFHHGNTLGMEFELFGRFERDQTSSILRFPCALYARGLQDFQGLSIVAIRWFVAIIDTAPSDLSRPDRVIVRIAIEILSVSNQP